MSLVSGMVFFRTVAGSFDSATVLVRYEDCKRAGDVSPRVIAEQVIRGVAVDMTHPRPIPFSLNVPASELGEGNALSVHVDVNGTGDISVGDYITTTTIPVTTESRSLRVVVDPVQ